jgi:hypothetical protein
MNILQFNASDEAPAGAEAFLATLFVYDDGDNEKIVTLCGIQNSPLISFV